jgi:hypothetical protein
MDMLLHRRMLVLVAGVALALAVVLVLLPRASSAAPPEPVDVEDVTLPGCDFPVEADVSGKSKVTDLPRAPVIEIEPPLGSRSARRSPPHPKH